MTDEIEDRGEKFLSRWSRLKRDALSAEPQPGAAHLAPVSGTLPEQAARDKTAADSPMPQLPPVDELTMDSDFRGFLHPKVGEDVKRAALKKLFSDPHFNVMDGLDTYIDDYSKPEPLPAEMLAQMRSAQNILKWARNEREADESAPTATPLPADAARALEATAPPDDAAPAHVADAGAPQPVPSPSPAVSREQRAEWDSDL